MNVRVRRHWGRPSARSRRSPLASRTISGHLARGTAGLLLVIWAIGNAATHPVLAGTAGLSAIVALRGLSHVLDDWSRRDRCPPAPLPLIGAGARAHARGRDGRRLQRLRVELLADPVRIVRREDQQPLPRAHEVVARPLRHHQPCN